MEMSLGYMEKTVEFLQTRQFDVLRTKDNFADEQGNITVRHTFSLTRGDTESFRLETLVRHDGTLVYYLEIVRFHGLRCYSFPLDSWKFRDAFVEFKFYAPAETGVGLSFIVDTPKPDE